MHRSSTMKFPHGAWPVRSTNEAIFNSELHAIDSWNLRTGLLVTPRSIG
jgi:hypothetical protein